MRFGRLVYVGIDGVGLLEKRGSARVSSHVTIPTGSGQTRSPTLSCRVCFNGWVTTVLCDRLSRQ